MKKVFSLVLALLLCACMFTVVHAEGDLIRVGYVQVGHESDWRMANTQNYIDVFTKENGYDLSLIDCDNDHAYQLECVRNFIEQDLDYIVIAPIQEAGWDTVLAEAQEAGIPVIIADRSVAADPSLYTTQVGTGGWRAQAGSEPRSLPVHHAGWHQHGRRGRDGRIVAG